jgi:hypothetical protein
VFCRPQKYANHHAQVSVKAAWLNNKSSQIVSSWSYSVSRCFWLFCDLFAVSLHQGCQLVYLNSESPSLGIILRALSWKMLVYISYLVYLDVIGTFYVQLVQFRDKLIFFIRFGMLWYEKSGSPGRNVVLRGKTNEIFP